MLSQVFAVFPKSPRVLGTRSSSGDEVDFSITDAALDTEILRHNSLTVCWTKEFVSDGLHVPTGTGAYLHVLPNVLIN